MIYQQKQFIGLLFALIAILIPQSLGEFFPFSHFPMYSSFPSMNTLYYMTDDKNNHIFLDDRHDFSTYKLDKKMEARLASLDWHSDDERQQLKKEAATQLLNEFGDSYSEKGKTVLLFEKIVFLDKNNTLQGTDQEIARIVVK